MRRKYKNKVKLMKSKKRTRSDVYLEILYRGLLHIRVAATEGDSQQCFWSAIHLHNIPDHIRSKGEEWHKYYLNVERPDYIHHCKDHRYLMEFYPRWNELEAFHRRNRRK